MEELDAGVFDFDQFPDFTQQYEATLAATMPSELRFTSCDGPVSYVGREALEADINNLKAALEGAGPRGPS